MHRFLHPRWIFFLPPPAGGNGFGDCQSASFAMSGKRNREDKKARKPTAILVLARETRISKLRVFRNFHFAKGCSMLLKKFVPCWVVIAILLFAGLPVEAQQNATPCSVCAAASPVTIQPIQTVQPCVNAGQGQDAGCSLTGPTVEPPPPHMPVHSCCSQLGPLDIPPLRTRIRDDTPPIGRHVGRPLFRRWAGY